MVKMMTENVVASAEMIALIESEVDDFAINVCIWWSRTVWTAWKLNPALNP